MIEVNVRSWQGRIRKRLLPREGWEEIEQGLYMLSSTARWVRPLFLVRKDGVLMGYEGREAAAEAARSER